MQEFLGILTGLFLFFCVLGGGFLGGLCGIGVLILLVILFAAPKFGLLILLIILTSYTMGD